MAFLFVSLKCLEYREYNINNIINNMTGLNQWAYGSGPLLLAVP
jgi:hypothetical protein